MDVMISIYEVKDMFNKCVLITWNIFRKKVKPKPKDEYTRQAFVSLSRKIPSVGSIVLKIGDKFYRCRQLG